MFKKLFNTLLFGLVSGGACAAGQWAWKNCLEEKANDLNNKIKDQQKETTKTKEN